jgi:hypothetical protein
MMRRMRIYLAIGAVALAAWLGAAAIQGGAGSVASGGIWCCHPK